MSDTTTKKSKFVLIREALDKLLSLLDPDPEIAGKKYEKIREKLIKFFAWQGSVYPEDLADKAIDRVIVMIDRGEEIQNLNGCVLTVARYVLLEHQREQQKAPVSLDELPSKNHPAAYQSESEAQQVLEQRLKCLERCMQNLRHRDHEMIVNYYQGEKRERIENREAMAKQFGISTNALCIQTHRIKKKVEECVRNCVKQLPPA